MSLLTLPICKSRKCSNSYWCDWGGDVSLVQMSVFGLIFGVLCNDTLPPYPEEESGHCSPSTPGNAGQGVFFLCMGPAGAPVFVSERQTLLIPSFPFSACCCFCYVYLGLLWFLVTSAFSLCWGPPSCRDFLQGDYVCRWIAVSVFCIGTPQPSLCLHSNVVFSGSFL